jgi:predicted RNase H-like HicB family nuclease
MKKNNNNNTVSFRGYTKKEKDHWVAICIDLNIVAQGKTAQKAEDVCAELIQEYVEYVCSKHSDEINKFIPRQSPQEFIDEYNQIVGRVIHPKRQVRNKHLNRFDIDKTSLTRCGA